MTDRQRELAAALRRVQCAVEGLGSQEEADDVCLRLARGLLTGATSSGPFPSLPHFHEDSAVEMAPAAAPSQLAQEMAGLEQFDLPLTVALIPSGVPVVGPLVDLVRAPFHRLSLFYVQRLAERQAAHNRQVDRILRLLAERVERQLAEKTDRAKEAPESGDG